MRKKLYALILSIITLCTFVQSDSLNIPEIELSEYYGSVTLLINMHLELWNWGQSSDSFEYYTKLLSVMDQYAHLDIIKYLTGSINISNSLSYTLDNLGNLLNKASAAKGTLERNMEMLLQTKLDCDGSKELSDKNYSLSLRDYNFVNMEKYLEQSLSYDRCSSEARIQYNAYKKIVEQIDYFYEILEKKNNYFNTNKYNIISNFGF